MTDNRNNHPPAPDGNEATELFKNAHERLDLHY